MTTELIFDASSIRARLLTGEAIKIQRSSSDDDRKYIVRGILDLRGMAISSSFEVEDVCFENAVLLDNCTLRSSWYFRSVHFMSGISCTFATLHKRFAIEGGKVEILPDAYNPLYHLKPACLELRLSLNDLRFTTPPTDTSLHFGGSKFLKNLSIRRTKICGSLRLDGAHVMSDLDISGSTIRGCLYALNISVQGDLKATSIREFQMHVEGNMCLLNCKVSGDCLLDAIQVDGGLVLQGAKLDKNLLVRAIDEVLRPQIGLIDSRNSGPGGCSVYMPHAHIGGGIKFLGIDFKGYIQATRIRVSCSFCVSTRFPNKNFDLKQHGHTPVYSKVGANSRRTISIAAPGSIIGGDCDFREISTVGCVDLRTSQISTRLLLGLLDQREHGFINEKKRHVIGKTTDGKAIRLRGVTIHKDVRAKGVQTQGSIECNNSKIFGNVNLTDACLGRNNKNRSLLFEGTIIEGWLKAENIETDGSIELDSAKIGQGLNFKCAKVCKKNTEPKRCDAISGKFADVGKAVCLDELEAGGNVYLDGISVKGHFSMTHAQIYGYDDVLKSDPYGPFRASLNLSGASIGGRLKLNHLKTQGSVFLTSAVIGQSLYFLDARLGLCISKNPKEKKKINSILPSFDAYSLYAERIQIGGRAILGGITTVTGMTFQDAKVCKKFTILDCRAQGPECEIQRSDDETEFEHVAKSVSIIGTSNEKSTLPKKPRVNLSLDLHSINIGRSFKLYATTTGGVCLSTCNIGEDAEIVLLNTSESNALFSKCYSNPDDGSKMYGLLDCDGCTVKGNLTIRISEEDSKDKNTLEHFKEIRKLSKEKIDDNLISEHFNLGRKKPLISAHHSHISGEFTIGNTFFSEKLSAGVLLSGANVTKDLILQEGTCLDVLSAPHLTVNESITFENNIFILSDLYFRDLKIHIKMFKGSYFPYFLRELNLDYSTITVLNLDAFRRDTGMSWFSRPKCSLKFSNISALEIPNNREEFKTGSEPLFIIEGTHIGKLATREKEHGNFKRDILHWLDLIDYHDSAYATIERSVRESGNDELATEIFLKGKEKRIHSRMKEIKEWDKSAFRAMISMVIMLLALSILYIFKSPLVGNRMAGGSILIASGFSIFFQRWNILHKNNLLEEKFARANYLQKFLASRLFGVLCSGLLIGGLFYFYDKHTTYSAFTTYVQFLLLLIISISRFSNENKSHIANSIMSVSALCWSYTVLFLHGEHFFLTNLFVLIAFIAGVDNETLKLKLEDRILRKFTHYGCRIVPQIATWGILLCLASYLFSDQDSVTHPLQYQANRACSNENHDCDPSLFFAKNSVARGSMCYHPKENFSWLTDGDRPNKEKWAECLFKDRESCLTIGGLAMGVRLSFPMIPNYLASDWIPSSRFLKLRGHEIQISYAGIAMFIELCSWFLAGLISFGFLGFFRKR